MSSLVDGVPGDAISIYDEGLIRGDGCFEVIRSYGGKAFAFDLHYRRLCSSAAALELDPPPGPELRGWLEEIGEDRDCLIRVLLTRGRPGERGRCLVMRHPVPETPPTLRLGTVSAPWHPGGADWELAGVKTISYAPNMAAGRLAQGRGFDDALLVSREGHLLEGPTFSVAFVVDGRVLTPDLDLGILDSITRRLLIDSTAGTALEFEIGRYPVEVLEKANEVMALSTIKEVTPVVAVDQITYEPGPVTDQVADLFRAMTKELRA